MALSKDCTLLAWGDAVGNVFLWRIATDSAVVVNDVNVSKPWLNQDDLDSEVVAIRFVGNSLYWMDADGGIVYRVSVQDGQVGGKEQINKEDGRGWTGAILPNGFAQTSPRPDRWLSREYVLNRFDLESGRLLQTCWIYPRKKGSPHDVEVMAVSADDRFLAIASACNAGIVRLRDFKLVRSFGIEAGRLLAFSPDGTRLAIGAPVTGQVVVLETDTGRVLHRIALNPQDIPHALAFASNDSLYFGHADGLWRLDVKSGTREKVVQRLRVSTMLIAPGKRTLYVGSELGAVRVYRLVGQDTSERDDRPVDSRTTSRPKPADMR